MMHDTDECMSYTAYNMIPWRVFERPRKNIYHITLSWKFGLCDVALQESGYAIACEPCGTTC